MIGPKTVRPSEADAGDAYELVTLRDGGVCVKCGRGDVVHRDHRKNRSQGGLTTPANLQLLCLWDHKYLTEHPEKALAEGWTVPGWANASEWPARRYVHTRWGTVLPSWVLYDDEGGWTVISDDEARKRMEGTS